MYYVYRMNDSEPVLVEEVDNYNKAVSSLCNFIVKEKPCYIYDKEKKSIITDEMVYDETKTIAFEVWGSSTLDVTHLGVTISEDFKHEVFDLKKTCDSYTEFSEKLLELFGKGEFNV